MVKECRRLSILCGLQVDISPAVGCRCPHCLPHHHLHKRLQRNLWFGISRTSFPSSLTDLVFREFFLLYSHLTLQLWMYRGFSPLLKYTITEVLPSLLMSLALVKAMLVWARTGSVRCSETFYQFLTEAVLLACLLLKPSCTNQIHSARSWFVVHKPLCTEERKCKIICSFPVIYESTNVVTSVHHCAIFVLLQSKPRCLV